MLTNFLTQVRQRQPLVHCITNYITANDCANLLLACGASPIMADDPEEAAEITAHADALVLNLGTLHSQTLPAMLASGRQANALGAAGAAGPCGGGRLGFSGPCCRTAAGTGAVHRHPGQQLRDQGPGPGQRPCPRSGCRPAGPAHRLHSAPDRGPGPKPGPAHRGGRGADRSPPTL